MRAIITAMPNAYGNRPKPTTPGRATLSPMTLGKKVLRWVELLALFVGGPMLLRALPGVLGGPRLFFFLLLMGAGCAVGLVFDKYFDRRKLWNARALPGAMGWMVLRWLLACAAVTTAFGLMSGRVVPSLPIAVPTGLFMIFQRDDLPWYLPLAILLFYPWVSVYPQNVIYRAFFCQRYRPILGEGWAMIVVNAAAFSLGHIMFNNWVVLALTFLGGLIFTRTYLRTGSLFTTTIEHALYGTFCFYLGIGIFLLYGASG